MKVCDAPERALLPVVVVREQAMIEQAMIVRAGSKCVRTRKAVAARVVVACVDAYLA